MNLLTASKPSYRTKLQGTSFPLADANGNCVSFIDDAGNVQAHYVYDAFGGTASQSGDNMADVFRFRFSSKYLDDETGLYYYGFRFYDPALGRWVNRDPIEEQGGIDIYGFIANSPVIFIDKLGQYISNATCNETINENGFGSEMVFINEFGQEESASGRTISSLSYGIKSKPCKWYKPFGKQKLVWNVEPSCSIRVIYSADYDPDKTKLSDGTTLRYHELAHSSIAQTKFKSVRDLGNGLVDSCVCPECAQALMNYYATYEIYYSKVAEMDNRMLDCFAYSPERKGRSCNRALTTSIEILKMMAIDIPLVNAEVLLACGEI